MSHNSIFLKLCFGTKLALAKLSLFLLISYVIVTELNLVLIYFLMKFKFHTLSWES